MFISIWFLAFLIFTFLVHALCVYISFLLQLSCLLATPLPANIHASVYKFCSVYFLVYFPVRLLCVVCFVFHFHRIYNTHPNLISNCSSIEQTREFIFMAVKNIDSSRSNNIASLKVYYCIFDVASRFTGKLSV